MNYQTEREELGWYFAGLGSTLGLRACGMEAGGGVYDEATSNREHGRRHSWGHRAEMRRLVIVERTLNRSAKNTLARVFTPFGAGRATYRLLTAMASEGLTLVGLALQTAALERIWRSIVGEARYDDEGTWVFGEPSPVELLMLLEHEVSKLTRGNRIPSSHRLHRVLDEAHNLAFEAIDGYAKGRTGVVDELRAIKAEENARELAALRARMAGGM